MPYGKLRHWMGVCFTSASAAITSRLCLRYLLNRRLCDLKAGLEALGKKKILFYPGIEIRLRGFLARLSYSVALFMHRGNFYPFLRITFLFLFSFLLDLTLRLASFPAVQQCTKYCPLGPPLHGEKLQNCAC
jgi:hypothetical protein